MKRYISLFVTLFLWISLACGQYAIEAKALDTLAIKIQSELNKGKRPESAQYIHRANGKVVGLERWKNADWDVYFRDNLSFEDSINYFVSVNKHPTMDTVVVDIYPCGRINNSVWYGPHEMYGDFRGGPNAFMERAKMHLNEVVTKVCFQDTVVLFFNNRNPSDLLLTVAMDTVVGAAFSDFFREKGEMHRAGFFDRVGFMYSSHTFEIFSDGIEIGMNYIGAEDFVSISFDGEEVSGISYRGGIVPSFKEVTTFFLDRKLPFSYYRKKSLIKGGEVMMKCMEDFFERKSYSGNYYISTFKR